MKLHTVPGSPNSRKVEAVISHLNLTVEVEPHAFADLRSPGFASINPNGKVPVLIDGAFTLWESNAIIQYLADKSGDVALYPRSPAVRADIARWLFWEMHHFNDAFGTLAFETVAKPRLNLGPADPAAIEKGRTNLARFAPVLERHVANRKALVGDTMTIADYAVMTFESYRNLVPFDWTAYPNINAYFDRLKTSEHWQRTGSSRKEAA